MRDTLKKMAVCALSVATLAIPLVSAESMETQDQDHGSQMTQTSQSSEVKTNVVVKLVTVTAVNGTTITATDKDGTTYTIDASTAKFLRKYGANSSLLEVSVGDKLRFMGTVATEGSTDVTALRIRNFSVHKWLGIVLGKIKSVGTDSVTLTNGFTVNISSTTEFRSKDDVVKALSDLKVGDYIRVWGVKDSSVKTDNADAIRLLVKGAKWNSQK